MYLKNWIIIAFFLNSKVVLSTPLVQDNEVFDDENHRCGFSQEILPSYSHHKFRDIYEFNWMVTINEKFNNSNASMKLQPFFDGVLIHPQAVLTNARLVESLKNKPVTVKIFQFQLSLTGFGLEEFYEESRDVVEIMVHPEYHLCSLKNDVALLILSRPFDLNKSANTICLPNQDPAMEKNLHCREMPFSLYRKPLEKNCPIVRFSSKDDSVTNEFLKSDYFSIVFESNVTKTNETSETDLEIRTYHLFCSASGTAPYFYGGTKNYIRGKTSNIVIFNESNDIVTNYLKWIKNILIDRFN